MDEKKVRLFLKKLKSTAVEIYGYDELEKQLLEGKKLTIKFGCDPSRPDLHLGHTVPLRQVKAFQELGTDITFIVGDYTAMIGDPSGKSKTRPSLTYEETRKSGETYYQQVTKILDPKRARICYNSEWLEKLTFKETLELAGKYTVARLLERDDFQKRFKNNTPIGIHEFFYPLMQGYDSVAINADVEIGGTDQTFNMLVGRDLQKDYGQKPQIVITFPLLPGLDGVNKMSKSLDNYIGIDEEPCLTFEKCMKVPDNLLEDYFRLTTDLQEEEYKAIMSKDIREAHFEYARLILDMYHGKEAREKAEKRYKEVASGGIPQTIKEIEVAPKSLTVVEMLQKAGFVNSTSEARKLVQNRGVKINNVVVENFAEVIDISQNPVISKGKSNFAKFTTK